jgi:hypothetical protein
MLDESNPVRMLAMAVKSAMGKGQQCIGSEGSHEQWQHCISDTR